MNPLVVGIRFQQVGKIYHFDATQTPDIEVGDFVVVETSRGQQIGQIAQIVADPEKPRDGAWKPIVRKATPRDLVLRQVWQRKEAEALVNCRAKTKELAIAGVKMIAAEYTFDGNRLTIHYSSESEETVDLSALRNELKPLYPRVRIEFRQIGPRDVAKILGGMGTCGMENRCCSRFLTDFSPISIRMAKAQGISLSPSEITGMCGRLRCCLIYEYEQYVEARKTLPKRGKRVKTPEGEGKVVDCYPLKQSVIVSNAEGVLKEFPIEEVQPWEEYQALVEKSKKPCPKHGDTPCNCNNP